MSELFTQDDLLFRGRTSRGISCEEFVRAVRKHAFLEKMSQDNGYMAEYAMTCLTDDALHWSETLPEDVRADWSRLRPALLAKYGAINGQTASSCDTMLGTHPTRSAFPVTDFVTGRISVAVDPVSDYLEMSDQAQARCLATRDIGKAATFQAINTDGGIELRFTSPGSRCGSWLGMIWQSNPADAGSYAAFFPVERWGSSVYVPSPLLAWGWSGPASVVRWTRSASNFLSPILVTPEGLVSSGVLVTESAGPKGTEIRYLDITNDLENFRRCHGQVWKEARLLFERL